LHDLQNQVNQPDFYRQSTEQTTKILNQIKEIENDLSKGYQRWQALES